jgi:hypothetical protein
MLLSRRASRGIFRGSLWAWRACPVIQAWEVSVGTSTPIFGDAGIGAIRHKIIGDLDKISEGLKELKKGSREKLVILVERTA